MPGQLWQETIDQEKIKTGDHKMVTREIVVRETVVKDPVEQRFKDEVIKEINKKDANKPLYDTGYMYVEIPAAGDTNEYTISHNLGQIPSLVSCFFSEVEEPREGVNQIFQVVPALNSGWTGAVVYYSGFYLRHDTSNKTKLFIMKNWIFIDLVAPTWHTTGYLRIMFWR